MLKSAVQHRVYLCALVLAVVLSITLLIGWPLGASAAPTAGSWSFTNVATVGQNGFTTLNYARVGDNGTVTVEGVRNGKSGVYIVQSGTVITVATVGTVLSGTLGTISSISEFAADQALTRQALRKMDR